MTASLAPIPEGSRMATDINRLETALRALRAAVADEPGAPSGIFAHDHTRGNRQIPFNELVTTGEGEFDWQEFYHYHALIQRSGRNREESFTGHGFGPQWFRVSTPDRLLWVRTLPTLLEALRGMPVSVTRSSSWSWDRVNLRPKGQARYVPEYEILVSSSVNASFDPSATTASLLSGICTIDHPICNQQLFDWQQDTLGERLFKSYKWSTSGVEVSFENKSLMERAMAELFPDVAHTINKTGKGRGTTWHVCFDLSAGCDKIRLS